MENFLSCGEISSHDRLSHGEILHMTDCHVEKALHMRNVKNICNVEKVCVQFMFFCHIKMLYNQFFGDLSYFVEIFLSRFTRFCVEKN